MFGSKLTYVQFNVNLRLLAHRQGAILPAQGDSKTLLAGDNATIRLLGLAIGRIVRKVQSRTRVFPEQAPSYVEFAVESCVVRVA